MKTIFPLLLLLLALPCLAQVESPAHHRARVDLNVWKSVLDSYFVDRGVYPAARDIQGAAGVLLAEGYWDKPVTLDPWGRLYAYGMQSGRAVISSSGESRFNSRDDLEISAEYAVQDAPAPVAAAPPFRIPPAPPRAPGVVAATTDLRLSKSTNDVVFTWTQAGGQTYSGTRAINKAFFSALTMFTGLSAGTYTYTGGLTNNRSSEFFDITDTTETNAGTVNNGGAFPPTPPTITAPPAGTFYIGLSGATLTGSNFSLASPDNAVWFPGGVQAFASAVNGTATQLTFDIPPGAVSGNITASVQNDLTANLVKGDVDLENPTGNGLTTIRTMGFAPFTGDYWFAGKANTIAGLHRYYYDSATTKKWLKTNQSGAYPGLYNCSTKTDRFNRIYCAATITDVSGSANSRMAVTSPPGNLQICRVLGLGILSGAGDSVSLLGAAADPNPDNVAGRDMVYFAFRNSSRIPTEHYIIQVPVDGTGCGIPSTAQQNYGNVGGPGLILQTIVGMAVDRDGALYFSDGTTVRQISFGGGSATTVKTGFTRLFGIDVKQEVNLGPVSFIGSDAPTVNPSLLKSWASDNAAAAPKTVRSTTNQRFATWGSTVASPTWSVTQQVINVILGNDATAFPIDRDTRLDIFPYSVDDGRAWISSPSSDPSDKGGSFQTIVRPAVGGASGDYSVIEVQSYWSDNISRRVCARSGDPATSAQYEPVPTSTNCGKPWTLGGLCDNKESFTAGGVGSFTENDGFEYCLPSACGGSSGGACKVHLRVSKQYAGDNYQVFFHVYNDPPKKIIAGSGLITAWKHEHLENDSMCRVGGILKSNGLSGTSRIELATKTDGTREDNLALGDIIHIFDSATPFENASHDIACIQTLNLDVPGRKVVIDLGTVANCGLPYSLVSSYAPDTVSADPFQFASGNGAGVCKNGSGVFSADTSVMATTANDEFLAYHQTGDGNGRVPYLPASFYTTDTFDNTLPQFRFARIWFKNCLQAPASQVFCTPNNQLHVMATEQSSNALIYGITSTDTNSSFVYVGAIATLAANQSTVNHEVIGHGHRVNPCVIGYHDTRVAWCDTSNPPHCGSGGITIQCLMDPMRIRDNGVNRFDPADIYQGISASCLDPNVKPPDPPVTYYPPEGAIRYTSDPE